MEINKLYTGISGKNLLPKTGQTISYDDYDDGYYEKGSPVSPRFIDNGDNTITDLVTNLMWVKTLGELAAGGADFSMPMSYANALIGIQDLNLSAYLGHNDWRMPNALELISIVNFGASPPVYSPFANIQDSFWSATTDTDASPYYKHCVYFGTSPSMNIADGDTELFYTRPVRSI